MGLHQDTGNVHGAKQTGLQHTLMAAMVKYKWAYVTHRWCPWCKINVSTADTDHCHDAK